MIRRAGLLTTVLLLTFLLVIAPASASPADEKEPQEHAPIKIRSNMDLLLPESLSGNGVRSGTGTALDPYIISDWRIKSQGEGAISIVGTDVHVILRNLELEGLVYLTGTTNLVFQDVTVKANQQFYIDFSNVVFEGLVVISQDDMSDGIRADDSEITIKGLRATGVRPTIYLSSSRAVLEDIDMKASGINMRGTSAIAVTRWHEDPTPSHVVIRDLVLDGYGYKYNTGVYVNAGSHAVVTGMTATRTDFAGWADGGATLELRDARLNGDWRTDLIDQVPHSGIGVEDGGSVILEDVELINYDTAIVTTNASVRGENVVLNNNTIGWRGEKGCRDCRITNSVLVNNGQDLVNLGGKTFDARSNWWGTSEGPEPERLEGPIAISPWLTEAPDGYELYQAKQSPTGWILPVALLLVLLLRGRQRPALR